MRILYYKSGLCVRSLLPFTAHRLYIAAAGNGGFAGVFRVSSIVGYNNTAARANLNWYTPVFRTIGGNTTDINDINLNYDNAGTVGMGDSMQIVGPMGNPIGGYFY